MEKNIDAGDADSRGHNISLNGEWPFAYQPENAGFNPQTGLPNTPDPGAFAATMPVPGYWDDYRERLRLLPDWSNATFNSRVRPIAFPVGSTKVPDAQLPYLVGIGWYRRCIHVPLEWKDRTVTLHVGGVALEAWVWLNGEYAGHHLGYSTPFTMPLERCLRVGTGNELLIAVANTRNDRVGCAIRGYAGRSAGIHGPVELCVGGRLAIRSLFMYAAPDRRQLIWNLELDGYAGSEPGKWQAEWQIRGQDKGRMLAEGTHGGSGARAQWKTETYGMQEWSDRTPVLYEISLRIKRNAVEEDSCVQLFGLRRLERDGMLLRLNGQPVFLRGTTDTHYFPLTCTAPMALEPYRKTMRILKSLGFNWLRFHTWVPNESHLQAADELGMFVQVEPPTGFGADEWFDILHTCRRHPAVVIYCCGNEELLDEEKIEFLRRMQSLCREHVPDALFSPMEALRGVDYGKADHMGPDAVTSPFRCGQKVNPRRLKLLQEFSDVLETIPGNMSFTRDRQRAPSREPVAEQSDDWKRLGEFWRWMKDDHPHLLHELCILGTYLDLDLEHRYALTRIGPALYAAARKHLQEEGLLRRAALYYRNSCALMALWRKFEIELVRRCRHVQGYDLLGAADFHWHRTGYPCGMLNEFYEMKPGETRENVLRYNGASVLLLDHGLQRNYFTGDPFELELLVSHYGAAPLAEAAISWHLQEEGGEPCCRGNARARDIPNGVITTLGSIVCAMPALEEARKLTLFVRLSAATLELENQWDFWVFPRRTPPAVQAAADAATMAKLAGRYKALPLPEEAPEAPLRIVSAFDAGTAAYLQRGGRVLLLWQDAKPEVEHYLRPMSAGRPLGDCATVIADHPLWRRFPHDGYCAWQFNQLLHEANPAVFNGLNLPFDPILEVVSTYKRVRKQALLYEYRVGAGRMLGCALTLRRDDPATVFLFDELLAYVAGQDFLPRHGSSAGDLRKLLEGDSPDIVPFISDNAFDANAVNPVSPPTR